MSSGFTSIVTGREHARGETAARVAAGLEAARASRIALLARTARIGRLPRAAWPAVALAARALGIPHETAIVSNLGRVTDPTLLSFSRYWFLVPPLRNRSTLVVGISTAGTRSCVTLSGHAETRVLRGLGHVLWRMCGLRAEEISHEQPA
jgi:hypothetical protein